MSDLWIFGDSFSAPYTNFELGSWASKYIKWKGYTPKTFGENLSDILGVNVYNFSLGGADNYTIFDLLMDNAPNFKKGDIIIVGWSDIVRFRLANQEDIFKFILPNMDNSKLIMGVTQNSINEILVNRSNDAYFEEFKTRFNFLNWVLKDYILIQWTPFVANLDTVKYYNPFVKEISKNIRLETNGEVNDTHLSEIGHIEMTDHFMSLINDYEARKKNNNILSRIF